MTSADYFGNLPPHNIDAEDAIIGALLVDSSIEVLEVLKESDFYSGRNQVVYRAICDLVLKNVVPDLLTVINHLKDNGKEGASGQLIDLVNKAGTVDRARLLNYAQIVKEKAKLRRTLRVCQEAVAKLYQPIDNSKDFLDELEQKVFESIREGQSNNVESVTDAFEAIDGVLTGVKGGGIPSGLDAVDALTGGLYAGEQVVVAGRPGMAKTAKLTHTCMKVSEKYAAALFSIEMPKSQIAMRILCGEAGIDLSKLRAGKLTSDEIQKLRDTRDVCRQKYKYFWIDDSSSLTPMELRAKVRRIASQCQSAGRRLAVVGIDYLQLMSYPDANSREQEVAAISRMTKSIAKDFGLTVVLLSQLNRQVELRPDRRPQLSDLRDSGSIEQDADRVEFLYRDSYYSGEEDGMADVIVAKQRNGPTGVCKVKFETYCTRFGNL